MRELTRSMMRLSWAVPLLGMNQMAKLVSPPDRSRPLDPATETFESLADVAYRQLGPRLRDVYEQGDRLQGRVVDAFFGVLRWPGDCGEDRQSSSSRAGPRPVPNPPAAGTQPSAGAGAGSAAGGAAPRPVEGWGPVPPT